MRPVTCWDQICGFRKFIRPFAFLPVSLSLNIVFFCCLSSSVCEPRTWWWSAWGMVLHTAVTLSRNGPTTMLCHCFEVVKDNHKKYGTGSKLSGLLICTGHLIFEFKLHHMNFLMGIVSMSQFQRAFVRQNRKKMCAVCIVRGSGRVGLSRCKWIFEVRAVCRPPGLLSRSCSTFPSHQSSQVSQGIQIYLCTPTPWTEISFSEPLFYLIS